MKIVAKKYTVEMTEQEVNTAVKALELYYKHTNKDPDVRPIRNALAGLVGISYMGEDA